MQSKVYPIVQPSAAHRYCFIRTLDAESLDKPYGTHGMIWTVRCVPSLLLKTLNVKRMETMKDDEKQRLAWNMSTHEVDGVKYVNKLNRQSVAVAAQIIEDKTNGGVGIFMYQGDSILSARAIAGIADLLNVCNSIPRSPNLTARCQSLLDFAVNQRTMIDGYIMWTFAQLKMLEFKMRDVRLFHGDLKSNNLIVSREGPHILCIDHGAMKKMENDWDWEGSIEVNQVRYITYGYEYQKAGKIPTYGDVIHDGLALVAMKLRHILILKGGHWGQKLAEIPSECLTTQFKTINDKELQKIVEEWDRDSRSYSMELSTTEIAERLDKSGCFEPRTPHEPDVLELGIAVPSVDTIRFYSTLDVDVSDVAVKQWLRRPHGIVVHPKIGDPITLGVVEVLEYFQYAGKCTNVFRVNELLQSIGRQKMCYAIQSQPSDPSKIKKLDWMERKIRNFCIRHFIKAVSRSIVEYRELIEEYRSSVSRICRLGMEQFASKVIVSQIVTTVIMNAILVDYAKAVYAIAKRNTTIAQQLNEAFQQVFLTTEHMISNYNAKGIFDLCNSSCNIPRDQHKTQGALYHLVNRILVSEFGTAGVEGPYDAYDASYDIPWTTCMACSASLTHRIAKGFQLLSEPFKPDVRGPDVINQLVNKMFNSDFNSDSHDFSAHISFAMTHVFWVEDRTVPSSWTGELTEVERAQCQEYLKCSRKRDRE